MNTISCRRNWRSLASRILFTTAALGSSAPIAAAQLAYVASGDPANTVTAVDLTTRLAVATIPVGRAAFSVAVSRATRRVYVANTASSTVSVIDSATQSVIATIPVPGGVYVIAVDPSGTRGYVTAFSGQLTVLDLVANTVATAIATPSAWGIAVSPDGTRIYMANRASARLDVRDATTLGLVSTFDTGSSPHGVALSPDGSRAYVANNLSGTISVFDTAAGPAPIATLPTLGFPTSVAVSPDGAWLFVGGGTGAERLALPGGARTTVVAAANVFGGVFGWDSDAFYYPIVSGTFNFASVSGATFPPLGIAMPVGAVGDFVFNLPEITGATYDASTGVLDVTGEALVANPGAANDVVASKFTITGEGGASYTLTDTANVDITSGRSFSLTLSATDRAALKAIVNNNGTSSAGATPYNLAAAEDWLAGSPGVHMISDLTGNTLTASLVAFTVTPGAGPGGTIFPDTPQTISAGGTGFFSLWPDFKFSPGPPGGTCVTTQVGNSYTTDPVHADCTVIATFVQTSFTATPSVGPNGSVAEGAQTLAGGDVAVFNITPDPYFAPSVSGTCGGTLAGNTFTTSGLTADCTVVVSFVPTHFIATPSAGANGTISPNVPQILGVGSFAVFTVTPDAGYTASVGGTCGGTLAGTTYTTPVLTANCTVVATFSQNSYTVTPSAGANGTITPATPQVIAHGGTATFTVTAATGYTAVVGGTCGGALAGTTYQTAPITAACTVAATFTQNTYAVTPSAGANGTITPATPQTITHGATAVFTVTPATGFSALVGGTCGGTLVGDTYTTAPITAACTVAATFSAVPVRTYSGPSATGSGTITAAFTGGAAGCSYTRSAFIPVEGGTGSPPAGTAPPGVAFPHGLFDFVVGGCAPGDTVTLTITYPAPLAPGTSYWKYGPTPGNAAPHWYVLPATISGNTAVFTITDGALGDDDLAANGTIVDQGGPGSPPMASAAIPTMSEWMLLLMGTLLLLTSRGRLLKASHRTRRPPRTRCCS